MMRKCLLCDGFFPSPDSGERHCKGCQVTRHHLVKEEGRSLVFYLAGTQGSVTLLGSVTSITYIALRSKFWTRETSLLSKVLN